MKLPSVIYSEEIPDLGSGMFRAEVINGLRTQPRRIAPKFFYDRRGSELFEAICQQPEYYLTRTELKILKDRAREVARLIGKGCMLIEFGSGASRKVRLLLEVLRPHAYLGIDISRNFLLESTRKLARDYPWLEVHAACADLCGPLTFSSLPKEAPRLGFYPGSSIGNFEPSEARRFLSHLRTVLGPEGALLIGVDLKKDAQILHAAYNDANGVTALFNLNLLVRMQRELEASVNINAFRHQAFYNEQEGRIEMHLRSMRPQYLRLDDINFEFSGGESIHTENSYKYSLDEFQSLARDAGYEAIKTWIDSEQLFSVHFLKIRNQRQTRSQDSGQF